MSRFIDRFFQVTLYWSIAFTTFGSLALFCARPQTTVELTAHVTADKCKDMGTSTNRDLMDILCPRVDGTGSVKLTFPRRAWYAMQAEDAGK